jgi:glutamate dehydrogenase (NADP+)
MLRHHGESLAGKRVAVSGSGNVALYAAQKLIEMGATVVTMSDSRGFLHFPDGFDLDHWQEIRELKETRRGSLAEYRGGGNYHPGAKPWGVPCDLAMPCATQNELDLDDAMSLAEQGLLAVCEGANMPVTHEAAELLRDRGILHAPGKASNAGGVAVSGLEQSQNGRLRRIMTDIHARCVAEGSEAGAKVDYLKGSNLAGFKKVAGAMLAYGAV